MSPITSITSVEQLKAVLRDNRKVIVKFEADWCGPCRALAPFFETLSEQHKESIVFCKVDVDEAAEVAESESVTCMPTIKAFHNGKLIDTVMGASQPNITKLVTDLLNA